MANFHVLMSNSLTEDRAGPSFAKQQQQQQQEVEQALQAPAQVGLNNNNGYCLPDANSSVNSFSAVHSKATPMKIGCKFGCLGAGNGQLNAPNGFCLGIDEDIIVADSKNHRIAVYAKMGALKFQFGDAGKRNGQLFYPRKVAVFQHNGNFVVCDRGNGRSRMQIFSKCGTYMFKISIRFMDIVTGLDVSTKGHIVAVDSVSPTVFVISEEGMLLHWFDCSVFVREPSDIAIRDNVFYLCDMKSHDMAVYTDSGESLYHVGNETLSWYPTSIDISSAGDLPMRDSHVNRCHLPSQGGDVDFKSVFEFPQLNVSRCCGLKITSEGHVVTLAKNNHQVLVMDLLYV
ncbi:GL21455 [Drosophila persimilis]|uniref:GL21455 n=1 Tax=Drosophila persimilis TaxID=7234 RepID=B4IR70_DROPE|nr:GL21455 [Drosophila persimilis]